MIPQIPDYVTETYDKLQKQGFQVYLVGGCVRNLLMGAPIKDWDLTTNATPFDIQKAFKESFYDNKFGTVGIPIKNPQTVIEITTFRTEEGYKDRRHPEKVSWGKTIEEDLTRRDFTINAIALKLIPKKHPFIVDPFKGQEDLEKKLVKAVGDPSKRFKEDALRLIRAIRIATELKFTIDKKTWEEIKKDAPLIKEIAAERVQKELLRILSSDNAYDGVLLLKESNLLGEIIPELLEGVGISQKRPGRHHTTDVFTHNILSLKYCSSKDPIVRFATLLHDVAKPRVISFDKDGLVIFHNHEVLGARMVDKICQRLKFSKKDKDKIISLVRWHMFSVSENLTDAAIRRFIRRVGVGNVKDMMDLRVGDRLGGGTQKAESWRLKLFKERIQKEFSPKPFSVEDMAVDGHDIMETLKIKPGPKVGEILEKLFEEVDEDLSKNKKEYLIERIKELA
jgi:tRNA nucleotidyltransferase (CCA-adding enzyme)